MLNELAGAKTMPSIAVAGSPSKRAPANVNVLLPVVGTVICCIYFVQVAGMVALATV